MTADRREMLSRFLGQYLRHRPASLGLMLEMGGWVDLRKFTEAAWRWGMSIGWSELRELIESDPQHAFSLDRSRTRIRANWGHTVAFPPEPEPATPPARLYTTVGNVELARVALEALSRPRGVSLYVTPRPADTPGPARGFGSSSLLVDAAAMHAEGFVFRSMGEGEWVVEEVPPRFIRRADGALPPEAIAGLPAGLRSLIPPPPALPGRPATWEEWKARKWSTTAGVAAIQPTRPDAPPGESTFTWQDAARYVLHRYGVTELPERLPFVPPFHGKLILWQIEFVPALAAGRELGLARDLDPDRLLCVVLLRGNFTWSGGPTPGETVRSNAWHYIFDGRTGNLLQEGG